MGLIVISFFAFVSLGLPNGFMGVAWPGIRHQFQFPVDALGIIIVCGTAGYMLSCLLSRPLIRHLGIGVLLSLCNFAMAGIHYLFMQFVQHGGFSSSFLQLADLGRCNRCRNQKLFRKIPQYPHDTVVTRKLLE